LKQASYLSVYRCAKAFSSVTCVALVPYVAQPLFLACLARMALHFMACFAHMALHHFMACLAHVALHFVPGLTHRAIHFVPGLARMTHSSVHVMPRTMIQLSYCRARDRQCTHC
jgi:hypothetical protein